MEFNSKTVPSAFEAVTPEVSFTIPFEENVIKTENYLPPPPVSRMSPRRKVATMPRPSDIKFGNSGSTCSKFGIKIRSNCPKIGIKIKIKMIILFLIKDSYSRQLLANLKI